MAVKIIDIGPDPSVVKRVTCRHCGAILEYVPNDVKTINRVDYGGGPDGEEWVVCPNCMEKAIIRSW